jgi:hypothetical protein
MEDAHTLRIVALSGGYSRQKANELLSRNIGVIASFSRALTEGLNANQNVALLDIGNVRCCDAFQIHDTKRAVFVYRNGNNVLLRRKRGRVVILYYRKPLCHKLRQRFHKHPVVEA